MKIKALDSFSASEVGMVHAGEEVDVTDVSEIRLAEWRAKGFIPKEAAQGEDKLVPQAQPKSEIPSGVAKTNKRKGLEAQADKLGIHYDDAVTDGDLLIAIKAAKSRG